MSSKNKTKGNNAEREYAQIFRDLGFSFCKTSRQSSRLLDDCGVDLDFLPFNVQIKYGYDKGINETEVLQYIRRKLSHNYPPYDAIHKKVNILIHKYSGKPGKKRTESQDVVYILEKELLENFKVDYKLTCPPKTGNKRGWDCVSLLEEHTYLQFNRDKADADISRYSVMKFSTFKELILKNSDKWEK